MSTAAVSGVDQGKTGHSRSDLFIIISNTLAELRVEYSVPLFGSSPDDMDPPPELSGSDNMSEGLKTHHSLSQPLPQIPEAGEPSEQKPPHSPTGGSLRGEAGIQKPATLAKTAASETAKAAAGAKEPAASASGVLSIDSREISLREPLREEVGKALHGPVQRRRPLPMPSESALLRRRSSPVDAPLRRPMPKSPFQLAQSPPDAS